MIVRKLCCQGCGADLEVDDDIRFVNCNYCGARLEIVRDATTTHSRLLDRIVKQTNEMAGDLKVIRLQNELEQLDRQWESFRSKFLTRDKHGNLSEPSAGSSIIGGILGIGFGLFWIVMTASSGAPGFVPLLGLVFVGAAIFNMINTMNRTSGMRESESVYLQQRTRLQAELQRASLRD